MKPYIIGLIALFCVFATSELGASEFDKNSERPPLFDCIKTAPANTTDLAPYYNVNRDGDGLGEELPSSIMYFKKSSKEYSTSMTVTDLSLCKRPIETKICQSFIKTITGKPPRLGTDISNTRIGGADYVTVFLAPIGTVEFSGVDNATAFIGIDTQDPPGGVVVLYVYAKKGTNLIQLTTPVKECAAQVNPNESDISFYKRCLSKKITAGARSKAKQLTELFKLNNISPVSGCGDFPPRDGFDNPDTRLTGVTYNPNYGYSVVIPKGLVGHKDAAPAPYHGFGIVLSWEPRSYVYVDGSYNSLDLQSLQEVEKTYLEWLKDRSGKIISIQHKNTNLGNLQALRYIAKHTCTKASGNFIDDYTFAFSKEKDIVYTVELLTTVERYKKDKRVLEQILRTWKLQPIK